MQQCRHQACPQSMYHCNKQTAHGYPDVDHIALSPPNLPSSTEYLSCALGLISLCSLLPPSLPPSYIPFIGNCSTIKSLSTMRCTDFFSSKCWIFPDLWSLCSILSSYNTHYSDLNCHCHVENHPSHTYTRTCECIRSHSFLVNMLSFSLPL